MSRFHDRVDAGRQLADLVVDVADTADWGEDGSVVLGLPRGGVPVAAAVARLIGAPLDVIVVRKLGAPWQPELALGAVGEDGVLVLNDGVIASTGLGEKEIDALATHQRAELARRATRYRGDRPRLDLRGRCAVIVDDGIATGSTASAASQVARAHGASEVVLAVPVAPSAVALALGDAYDEVLCLASPDSFSAVGEWYVDFSPTSDDEVIRLLRGGTHL